MNWKTWLKGLAVAAVGGAATGVADAAGKGQLSKTTAVVAGVSALTTVVAYLLQSPLLGSSSAQSETAQPAETGAAAK